jgi:hypothetical protein
MIFRALLAAICVFAVGCNSEEVGTVTGKVTRAGKPVPEMSVIFVPERGRPSRGLSDENGRYVLLYMPGQEGALVGKHRVWVQLRPVSPKDEQTLQNRVAKMRSDPEIKKILDKYGNEAQTALAFEVASGSQSIDIALD